jgi:hypothetical protein
VLVANFDPSATEVEILLASTSRARRRPKPVPVGVGRWRSSTSRRRSGFECTAGVRRADDQSVAGRGRRARRGNAGRRHRVGNNLASPVQGGLGVLAVGSAHPRGDAGVSVLTPIARARP